MTLSPPPLTAARKSAVTPPSPPPPPPRHHPRHAPMFRMKADSGRTNQYSMTHGIAPAAQALWFTSHGKGHRLGHIVLKQCN